MKRILVVEDNANLAFGLRNNLEIEGYAVEIATDGAIGLERARKGGPDLVLLDLMLPEMDGFQFMQELRKQSALRSVPIIVITAKDITEEDRGRLNSEVARILHKTALSMAELVSEIRLLTK